MTQLRLAASAATKFNRLFTISSSGTQSLGCRRLSSGSAISGGGGTAAAIHAARPEEKDDASEAAKAASSTNQSEFKISKQDDDPYVPPNPLHPSSPKVQSNGVNQPKEPITQQKRRFSSSSSTASTAVADAKITEVSCAGLDGSPWPEEDGKDRRRQSDEADNKEYFEHHKASPFSEIEIADTRKPSTRATDGTADNYYGDYGSGGVILWRPEQLDAAEDSLRRATEIWRTHAMRGDPDSPHGRVLRALRCEYW